MPKVSPSVVNNPLPTGVDPSRLLSLDRLTEWWGVSRKYVWELTKRKGDKKLPSYKLGRRRVFIYDECYWYLKKQEV